MAEIKKTVRFYEAVKLNQADQRRPIADGFWTRFIEELNQKDPAHRESVFNRVTYVGEAHDPVSPPLPYIQVRRVRALSEQIDQTDIVSGLSEPLELGNPNLRVAEPTYLVPFGPDNYVAVMSPAARGTSPEALDTWITEMCGLSATEDRFELRPIVDEAVLDKLISADGASSLSVRIPKGGNVPPSGGGVVADAMRDAAASTSDELDLTMTWSFGHARGSHGWRENLQAAATWVARSGWTDKASVNIRVEDENGEFRTETHSIFRDRITKQASFDVREGERASEKAILSAIALAIRQFRQQTESVRGAR